MFYQGDLQSGIATAMREAKPVVCFVRDDHEESTTWENEYFDNDELRGLVSDSSVTLRLIAGTQEAGFLTSICPIQTFPAVIVIRNGMLQEYLVAGTSKDAFQTRLKTAIAASSHPIARESEPNPAVITSGSTHTTELQPPLQNATTNLQPQAPIVPAAPQLQTQIQPQQPVQGTAERLRESIRAGKRPETHETPEEKKATQEKEERHALQTKIQREQREQREERERIREQIKKDQEARRQRAAEEQHSSIPTTSTPSGTCKTNKQSSQYRLQIRLFDGSSVRNSFPPSATIRKDVRPWLESQRSDGSAPYNLKHILTPLPNRTISVAEEERTLEELDLGPTASLVMVPVPSYIEAYAPSGIVNSIPGKVVSSGYGLISGVVGGVAGMVGGLFGYGGTSNQATATSHSNDQQNAAPTTASNTRTRSGQGINIRTIHDQRNDRDEREFYNGNTLNFEPRRGDDLKDK
ncbi:UBX domain protein [Talaromyces stipitatus ATCC 10500]|uniref:UBX domain protein n=1 Tax=Talaromyces stipitatus (strain ATCC 10500 / CBS 375.48 / QM 6759 / NRRL 1006) TaxID=441959 RepID=B8MMW3_TALSN|nr:UBX domain protein [Talaromyces stipitatus ATCC 10500]EED13912.1 UBX domain protein [Talaromyces stipitatus ATCC 10500]